MSKQATARPREDFPELTAKTEFELPYSPNGEETILPHWAEPLIDSLSCNCYQKCEELSAELPIIGMEHAAYEYEPSYVPSDLVRIADFRFGYVLHKEAQLHSKAIESLGNFMEHLERIGYKVILRSGYRSFEEQDKLHHEEPNAAAPAGFSQHQSGFAFDIHKRTADNQVGDPLPFSREVAEIANSYGIVHPFDWDRPHYLVLDAVCSGATQALISADQNPNNADVIYYFLEALKRHYKQQAP